LPLARAGAWGVRAGGHPRGLWDPSPRWGETPGPLSRIRARWDPQSALGLAIRAARLGEVFGRRDLARAW
jgi:hypothetical protein